MPAVALGPDKFVVELPDNIVADYRSGKLSANGVKDYAISNGLAQPEQVGLTNEAAANPPVVDNAFQAAMIGAGRETARTGSNIVQAVAELANRPERAAEEKAYQAEQARLAEPVKQQYPKASFAGEMLPAFAVPGGKAAQVTAGATLGALEGDTLGERVFNASVGALASLAGQKVGDYLSGKAQLGVQKFANFAKAGSRRVMQELNIPMTIGQRGSPVARFFERIQSTITGRNPMEGRQLKALNRLAARAIGESSDRLDDVTLSRAHTRIGRIFESVGEKVPKVDADEAVKAGLGAISQSLDEIGTDSNVVQKSFNTLQRDFLNGNMTGARYVDFRSKLGKLSRQFWRAGNEHDAQYIDEMMQLMDDAVARVAPKGLMNDLVRAGREWRFLAALRRGSSISPEGDININSLNRALASKFPGYDVGKGTAGDLGRAVRATRDVVRPFRSSGTAERLVGAGAVTGSLISPQNAGRIALGLAAPFAGGGAGPALAGNAARQLALLLARKKEQ